MLKSLKKIPTIYCITGENDKERQKFILDQAKNLGLTIHFHFYTKMNCNTRSCLNAHVSATLKFLDSNEDECIIMEDDVIFHKDFKSKLIDYTSDIPENISVISLGYIYHYGKTPQSKYLFKPDNLMAGMQMYLISRHYATACVEWYNSIDFDVEKCGRLDDGHISSETPMNIQMRKSGLLAYPMLAIESVMLSSVRDPERIEKQGVRRYWFNLYTSDFDYYNLDVKEYAYLFGDYINKSFYLWGRESTLKYFVDRFFDNYENSDSVPTNTYDVIAIITYTGESLLTSIWKFTSVVPFLKSNGLIYLQTNSLVASTITRMINDSKFKLNVVFRIHDGNTWKIAEM